jgi:pyridinium-3,5-bisthiocarboxylic acid mononucleotide nickel chelatase
MKVLYFDCFSGISGDMTLGALIDLGVEKDIFLSELDKLNIGGYDIVLEKKIMNGIVGTDVKVILVETYSELQDKIKQQEFHEQNHTHSHSHEHPHEHNEHIHKDQQKPHSHDSSQRNLKNIETIIDMSDLSKNVKDFSKKVFHEIAKAEAKVHHKDINEIHFHEVGAIDSIVDIVGVAICLDLLGVKKIFSSPLHDGHGFIECQHGIIPVPVPAVMEMLSDSKIPLISDDINTELITPTGMGIIKCLTSDYGSMPAMIIEKVGYGMGKRDTGKFNALRIVMGTLFEEANVMEEIAILETNIDNMNPEIIGYVTEKLLSKGALDVFTTPIYMKKNRPAFMLTVLTTKELEEGMTDILFKETTTLGIRRSLSSRYVMNREIVKVDVGFGEVKVKVASKGDIKKYAPEYEDCRALSEKTGMPLKLVYDVVNEKSKYLI